ncbi:MAG: hypothetical protein KBT57_04505 [bacterium]|nr:hypothetical protein [Candidatus Limimorpha equi]
MFDFLFQALYFYFERREKGGDSVWTASFYVALLQYIMFCSLAILLDIISDGTWSVHSINLKRNVTIGLFLGIMFLFYYFNLRRYRKKKDTIIAKYKDHPANKWFRGWMYVIIMALLFFSPILWALLHGTLIVNF